MDLEWCKGPDRGLPRPDVVFYLSISVDDALKRGDFGNERYEKADFQRKVMTLFEEKLMVADSEETWLTVDATRSIESIQAELRALAEQVIKESGEKPVKSLWSL